MYAIKFTEEQLSFLFNNLESKVFEDARFKDWWKFMDTVCWDEDCQILRPEHCLILNEQQTDEFYLDMVCDAEEILHQLEMDVRYNTLNDTSWSNSRWCLDQIASILDTIRNAKVIGE